MMSDLSNERRDLPSSSCVHNNIWVHHMFANKIQREKARWKFNKNAECRLQQILK